MYLRDNKRLIIIIDEASRIYDRSKENTAAGIPTIDILTCQSRHSKITMIAATQEISKVTNSLIGNTPRKIVFKQDSGKDEYEAATALQLSREQREYLPKLNVGEAVVKDRPKQPFLIRTHLCPVTGSVTEQEVVEASSSVIRELMKKTEPRSNLLNQKLREQKKNCDDFERSILSLLCKKPVANAEDIAQLESCSRAKVTRVRDSLAFKGLLKKIRPLHFQQGGGRLLYELTEKARQLCRDWGFNYYHPGKCGLEGYYYLTEFVIPFLTSRGFKTKLEGRSLNSTVDLIAEKDGTCLAIELELSDRNVLNNLHRNLQATGFDRIVLIFKDKDVQKRIGKTISGWDEAHLKRISMTLISDFATGKIHFQEGGSE
jgi:hypothetical protein